MKKIILIISQLLIFCWAAKSQDVIDYGDDSIYFFNPLPSYMEPLSDDLSSQLFPHMIVQQYVPSDTLTIYGVALTFDLKRCTFESINDFYQALLMKRAEGRPDSVYHIATGRYFRPLQYLDTVRPHDSTRIKHCKFRYIFNKVDPSTGKSFDFEFPCHEFYFDTPWKLSDTFYVGRDYNCDLSPDTIWINEMAGIHNPPQTCLFYLSQRPVYDTSKFQPLVFYSGNYWGFTYPIIGLRCKPMPNTARLVSVGYNWTTVSWRNFEDGTVYNVRLKSDDESVDTIVVTTDTSYTFDSLPPDKRYSIHVRKQCHYATSTYDTIVYSAWQQATIFNSEPDSTVSNSIRIADGVDFSLTPNPAHGRVGVALPGEAVGGRLTLCDLTGRELASYSVAATAMELDISTLSAGAYILKLVTLRGISTRRLLVE